MYRVYAYNTIPVTTKRRAVIGEPLTAFLLIQAILFVEVRLLALTEPVNRTLFWREI